MDRVSKMKRKMRVVDIMSKILEDGDLLCRDLEICLGCGREPGYGDTYCSTCGVRLSETTLASLDESIIDAIWEAFQAGLEEWEKSK